MSRARTVALLACLLPALARADGPPGKLIVGQVPKSAGFVEVAHPAFIEIFGEDGGRVEPEAFYLAVGRPDLARRYLARRRTKIVLNVSGFVLNLAGAVTLGAYLVQAAGDDHDPSAALGWTSLGLLTGGTIVYAIGTRIPAHPVSLDEARALADEHNRTLELGPAAVPGGAGVSLSGSF